VPCDGVSDEVEAVTLAEAYVAVGALEEFDTSIERPVLLG
jgi:hypothetical protein